MPFVMPSCRHSRQGYGVGFGVGRTLSKRVEKPIHGYDEREFLPYAFEAYRCWDDAPKRPFQILQGRQLQVFRHRTAVQSILYTTTIFLFIFVNEPFREALIYSKTRESLIGKLRGCMSAHYCFLSLSDRDTQNR